jgi:8-oxo-dGTP diphosphatase
MSNNILPHAKRLYPDQPIVGVGALILKDDAILLEKRKNMPGKGRWSVPGGLVELGETLDHAVIREVGEETCLLVFEPCLVDVVDNVELDEAGRVMYHFVIVDYHVKVKSGVPRALSDAEEVRWVPLKEVEEYNLTGSFRFFFKRNKAKLKELSSSF